MVRDERRDEHYFQRLVTPDDELDYELETYKFCCNEYLDLNDCEEVSRLLQLHFLTLTAVDIISCEIGNEGCIVLSEGIQHLKCLERLDLKGNPIGIEGCRALSNALQHLGSLKELNLHDTGIGDQSCLLLTEGINKISSLQILFLGCNNISDGGCVHLANVIKGSNPLKELSLRSNKIGDLGCRALAQGLKTNNLLESLDLDYNFDITDEVGMDAIGNILFNHNTTLYEAGAHRIIPYKMFVYLELNKIGRKDFIETSDKSVLSKAATLESLTAVAGLFSFYVLLREKPEAWCEDVEPTTKI